MQLAVEKGREKERAVGIQMHPKGLHHHHLIMMQQSLQP